MSQTDIRNSNQYQQAPAKMRPSHSSAADFYFPSRCRGSADVVMSRFVCLSAVSNSELSKFRRRWKVLHFSGSPNFSQPIRALGSSHGFKLSGSPCGCAWVCVYFPYGCSRSPLNKTVVPLLSKPTSFVSNEHLPGSLPTTAGFSVSPCQQPMTLICCFITPKRCTCMCVCGREEASEEGK